MMTPKQDPRAEMILQHGPRLITVARRCAWSLGAVDALNDILSSRPCEPEGEWREPVSILHRDALLMVVLRVALLLDAKNPDVPQDREQDDGGTTAVLSFQIVRQALKEPAVQAALLQSLEAKHGADYFSPSRTDLLEEYFLIYSEIDWGVYGRLRHLRLRYSASDVE
jgi:hypothetical protein